MTTGSDKQYNDEFDKANRALFEGNRGEVATIVQNLPDSGRKRWLLATTAEDEKERAKLLQEVIDAGYEPYAQMAREILERELRLHKEMRTIPKWQAWVQRNSRPIIFICTVISAIALALLVLGPRLFPSTATGGANGTAESPTVGGAVAQTSTPLPTATVSPVPPEKRTRIDYLPIGSLELLNVEFPTTRPVSSSGQLITPPRGAAFIAIQYQFTCGTVRAFCERPPEAALRLQLADTRIEPIPYTDYTLSGEPPLGSMAAGIAGTAWLVFPVPVNQAPSQLLIDLDTDGDSKIDQTLKLSLSME